jgi:hypothetical protein
MLLGCPSGGHPMPHVTAAACGSALRPCRSRQHGLPVGQCLTELLVYKLYRMLLWFCTSCAVGFEGRNWHRLSSVLGHWSPGGVLLVLHQGRFAAICAMNLARNACDDDVARLLWLAVGSHIVVGAVLTYWYRMTLVHLPLAMHPVSRLAGCSVAGVTVEVRLCGT